MSAWHKRHTKHKQHTKYTNKRIDMHINHGVRAMTDRTERRKP